VGDVARGAEPAGPVIHGQTVNAVGLIRLIELVRSSDRPSRHRGADGDRAAEAHGKITTGREEIAQIASRKAADR